MADTGGGLRHVPRKRFGQHFLVDRGYIARIVDSLALRRDDAVVEVGPGLGALTEPLLLQLDHLHVIEIDRDLAGRLLDRYPAERLTIHTGDALRFDFSRLGSRLRVVGNLPYNISTPLLFHIGEYAPNLRDVTVMLQKEVVDRMAAQPATPAYGRLSVMLQSRFSIAKLFDVPPGAFRPPPQVRSAVVRLEPLAAPEVAPADRPLFEQVVTAAFGQRRKTLRNALGRLVGLESLDQLSIDGGVRGEALSVADFARLTEAIAARRAGCASRDDTPRGG